MDEQSAKNKKELKQKAQELKIEEKQKELEEKQAIKKEKERRKNSFPRKVRNFFLTIILVIILLLVGFYFGKQYLSKKETELTNKKMSQIYNSALSLIEEKDYKKAIEILKSIDENYSNYQDVKDKLKEVEQLYLNSYLVEADEYLKDKEYDKALEVLNDIDKDLQKSEIVQNKKIEIKIAKLNREIEKLVSEKKENIDILEYIINYEDEKISEIKKAKEELITKYKSAFLLETRTLMNSDYSKAKQIINKIQELLPKDDDIKKLVEEFNKIEPTAINLLSLEQKDKKGNLVISDEKDKVTSVTSNTEYTKYILKPSSSEGTTTKTPHTIEFNLDKKYAELKGIICVQSKGESKIENTYTPKITFYNGNKIIYYTENVNDQSFSINVKDVDKLIIEFEGTTTESYFIANPELTPIK